MNFIMGLVGFVLTVILLFLALGVRADRRVADQHAEQLAALRAELLVLKEKAAPVPALVLRQDLHEGKLVACERRTLHLRVALLHLAKMAGLTRLPGPVGPATWPPWPADTTYRWDPDGFIRQTLDADTKGAK